MFEAEAPLGRGRGGLTYPPVPDPAGVGPGLKTLKVLLWSLNPTLGGPQGAPQVS